MGMIKRKPGDMNLQQDVRFNWDTFIHNVTNGKYILLLGSEVMLKKDLGDDSCGDSHKAMFNAVRSVLVEDNVLAPNNTADNFTDLSDRINNLPALIRKVIDSDYEFTIDDLEPGLVELMKSGLFRVVLTTTFDPYALELMESVWGKGNVRVMNINSLRSNDEFDFPAYINDDTVAPLPPTLYYIFGKAFPKDDRIPFVVTDNDAIVTLTKWMGNSAPGNFLEYIRSKRIIALGCKFDDWFFRFFWYMLRGEMPKISWGEVAVSLDMDVESDRKLKKYLDHEKIFFQHDARTFIADMLEHLRDYRIADRILDSRSYDGVFISYAHEDFQFVSRLFFSLRERGISAWFDERNLLGGDSYDRAIPDAICRSRIFLPVLSAQCQADMTNGITRFYKDTEWAAAQTQCNINPNGLKVLPVRLPGYDTRSQVNADMLPPCMRVTLFDLEQKNVNELARRIKELLNSF
ncbi:MAG: toll/interleukin-1 receptor domain-containing protein [Bacteroidaceae bacterium]|nr:toll/interleukin-1 receptor domain-containing protein [Bacteroidaceae bacterium]